MSDPFADGFLSECVAVVRNEVHRRYPAHVALTKVTNRRAVELQHELRIHLDRLEEGLGAALFARTLAFTQSSVLELTTFRGRVGAWIQAGSVVGRDADLSTGGVARATQAPTVVKSCSRHRS